MIRGERFELNLDDDEGASKPRPVLPASFVGDVLERRPAAAKAPSLPTLKSKTGFPEHRKRPIQSHLKQQRNIGQTNSSSSKNESIATLEKTHPASSLVPQRDAEQSGDAGSKSWADEERRRIDQENRQRLADMSPEQIEAERRELMDSISPSLLQKLLRKANIESGSGESNLETIGDEQRLTDEVQSNPSRPPKTVTFAEHVAQDESPAAPTSTRPVDSQRTASTTDDTAHNEDSSAYDNDASSQRDHPSATEAESTAGLPAIHFPQPAQPPDLDPSSPSFLADLHAKYFPSLPTSPASLSWMQPTQAAENAAYDPSSNALAAKDIRFSFTGELIPPSRAHAIPVTAGLHHHADAPDAAGYTIAELAHLARSTVPAQRCVAFQTLGRVLYRLGRGEFGNPSADCLKPSLSTPFSADELGDAAAEDLPAAAADEAGFSELAQGLWREVERCQVVTILVDESEGNGVDRGRHLSAKAYATEAVWLWRKGGGRRWKAA